MYVQCCNLESEQWHTGSLLKNIYSYLLQENKNIKFESRYGQKQVGFVEKHRDSKHQSTFFFYIKHI